MWIVLAIAVFAVAEPAETNLLANPGFETLEGRAPALWKAYVAPMEGASASVDGNAHEGAYCARLQNPMAYSEEPLNNWSQYILGRFGGKSYVLSGVIRTEHVTEASIGVQCWSGGFRYVLAAATTATDLPLHDTQGWTPVKVAFQAPSGAEALMVRCYIKGSGTAWFDALRLHEGMLEDEEEMKKEEVKGEKESLPAEDMELGDISPEEQENEAAYAALLEANRALSETIESLSASNAVLAEEVRRLRVEMEGIQRDLVAVEELPETAVIEKVPVRVPPLVPFGFDMRGLN